MARHYKTISRSSSVPLFPPFSYSESAFARELSVLRRVGFDFVRFAVDPGPFLQWQDSRRDYLDQMLISRIRMILSYDLSVIVDFHPSDIHPDYLAEKITAGSDKPLFKEYLRLLCWSWSMNTWTIWAALLKSMGR